MLHLPGRARWGMSETALAAARRYKRELGWAPIPVPVREKNPGFDNWQHLTIAEEELPKFFNGRPQNLGLLLGEPSGGLADTDCDAPEAIRLAPHFLPATPCRFGRPSKPRSHYLYQVEGALRTVKFVDAVPQQGGGGSQPVMLVELRFTGCQTLVPPSTHPSGEAIAWEDPDAAAAVVAAGELRAAVGQLAAATLLARHWPGQGARQETALALAGALLHAGWGEEQTGRFVGLVAGAAGDGESAKRAATSASTARAAGLGRPTTGWPRLAELLGDRVVDKAREWLGVRQPNPHNQQNPSAADEPVAWEPPAPIERYPRPDFPAACLPPVLRAFVTALATATQTPAALAALICLAVVAAAAAKRVAVKVRAGWVEPVNIMTVPALPPGNRKSAVYREATEPLVAHEAHERERLAIEIAQKQTEYRILEKRLERAQREASNGEGIEATKARADALEYAKQLAAFEVPAIPRLLVDDVSPERLATLLAEHGGRMGVFSAEGGLFETIAGRYANGVPSLDVFLKGHAGDDLRVDRVGRPPEFVTAPALTVALAVQPDVIFGLARKPGFRGRGLLARLWVALLVSTVGRRAINPPPVPDDVREDYAGLVTGILRLVPLAEQDGSPKPRLLELSYAAAARFVAFEEALEPRLGENGDLAAIADWAAKLPGAVARLAGLLHVAHE